MATASRSMALKVRNIEWAALKHTVGVRLRSSLLALKQEMLRVNGVPGFVGKFGEAARRMDQSIDAWTIKPGEEVPPELEDGPAPVIVPGAGPGFGPPPGFGQPPDFGAPPGFGPPPGIGQPRGNNAPPGSGPRPGRGSRPGFGPPGGIGPRRGAGRMGVAGQPFEDPNTRYQKMLAEFGARCVTVVYIGMPSNSDASLGVTMLDVSKAVNSRLRELAPGATTTMTLNVDGKASMVLAPVDDVSALANSIDFGKATVQGSRIEVTLSPEYIASVPRQSAEPSRAVSDRVGRDADPAIPGDADPVTRSLAQLNSGDLGRRKEAIQRLGRTQPNDRLDEVVTALLPLLDDDDGFLVNEVVDTLGVWRSPIAVPKLIERTGDNRFFVRKHAIKVLGKYKDPRAAEPIAERLKEDGFEAEDALKAMGSIAEPTLIDRLKHPDSDTRRRACNILRDIGGAETLAAMRSIPPDPDFGVRAAAQDAMKHIRARVGSAPASPRPGAADSSPPSRRRKAE